MPGHSSEAEIASLVDALAQVLIVVGGEGVRTNSPVGAFFSQATSFYDCDCDPVEAFDVPPGSKRRRDSESDDADSTTVAVKKSVMLSQ